MFRALGLGESGNAAIWNDAAARAWTLLSRAYEHTRAAAGVLFGNEESAELSYPSLVAAVRQTARRLRPAHKRRRKPSSSVLADLQACGF